MMQYTSQYWPARPKSLENELLSSWLVRIAHEHGLIPQSFSFAIFGSLKQLWGHDIDRHAPEWLIEELHCRTGVMKTEIKAMTMQAYKGWLYPAYHPFGPLNWILPLKLKPKQGNGYGLQYCPQCLAEDAFPYYRKAWRTGLCTFCHHHQCLLQDHCPTCQANLLIHQLDPLKSSAEHPDLLRHCWQCDAELTDLPKKHIDSVDSDWLSAVKSLDLQTPDVACFDYSKLSVIRHFCVILASHRLAPKLYPALCKKLHLKPYIDLPEESRHIESYRTDHRHQILTIAWWLLDQWPSRLIDCWEKRLVRYNVLLKDFHRAPDWYSQVINTLPVWRPA